MWETRYYTADSGPQTCLILLHKRPSNKRSTSGVLLGGLIAMLRQSNNQDPAHAVILSGRIWEGLQHEDSRGLSQIIARLPHSLQVYKRIILEPWHAYIYIYIYQRNINWRTLKYQTTGTSIFCLLGFILVMWIPRICADHHAHSPHHAVCRPTESMRRKRHSYINRQPKRD